jgi:hypothetical protein
MMSGLTKGDDVWCTRRDDTAYACFSIAFVASFGRAFMIPFISGPSILTFHFYIRDFAPLGSTFVITFRVLVMYILLLVSGEYLYMRDRALFGYTLRYVFVIWYTLNDFSDA